MVFSFSLSSPRVGTAVYLIRNWREKILSGRTFRKSRVIPCVDRRAPRVLHALMRIIAGMFRGRRLKVPRGDRVRPTADRVKESVFSIVAHRLEGARVLDIFAGSGALGLEALPRGAGEVVV